MEEQNYMKWEVINQKEYKRKISIYTEKLDKQQKELFKEILSYIKNAGGVEENVLHMLLEEQTDICEKLQLLFEYLKRNVELISANSELAFYKKRHQGAEEKNKTLKKEIMELKLKNRELDDKLAGYQEQLLKAEEVKQKDSEQMEALVQMQESLELIMADNREIKGLLVAYKEKIFQNNDIIDAAEIAGDNVGVTRDYNVTATESNTTEKEESKENTVNIENTDEALYEEFQGIAIENAIDPDEYGTFMEAAPDEIMYYPLEEEEVEEELKEAGKERRVNFFNHLLGKMDLQRFQKLEPSEQISKLFDLVDGRIDSKEEKKEFMEMVMGGEVDYGRIYQYIKEGREKELLKEEQNG